jgi:molecular chaperone DnaK (HSP70)
MFDDNVRLGVFEITDIPPRPRGQVTIKVTMKVRGGDDPHAPKP